MSGRVQTGSKYWLRNIWMVPYSKDIWWKHWKLAVPLISFVSHSEGKGLDYVKDFFCNVFVALFYNNPFDLIFGVENFENSNDNLHNFLVPWNCFLNPSKNCFDRDSCCEFGMNFVPLHSGIWEQDTFHYARAIWVIIKVSHCFTE